MNISINTYQKSMEVLNHIANQEAKEIGEFVKYIPYESRKNYELIEVIQWGDENQTESKED